MGPVMRAAGDMIELVQMNFSFPPSGPRVGRSSILDRKGETSPTASAA